MGCGTSKPRPQRQFSVRRVSLSSHSSSSISSTDRYEKKHIATGIRENERNDGDKQKQTVDEDKNTYFPLQEDECRQNDKEGSGENEDLLLVTENDDNKQDKEGRDKTEELNDSSDVNAKETKNDSEENDELVAKDTHIPLQEDEYRPNDKEGSGENEDLLFVTENDDNKQDEEDRYKTEELNDSSGVDAKETNNDSKEKDELVAKDEEEKVLTESCLDNSETVNESEKLNEVENETDKIIENKECEKTEKEDHEMLERTEETKEIDKADVIETRSTIGDNEEDIDDGYDDNYTPFDEEEDENLEIEGYEQNVLGLMIKTVDFRLENSDEQEEERPFVDPGELYTDKDFPLEIAIVQDTSCVEWKRPGEFLSEPRLFYDEATRFDIGQGSAGTCWFLSTVATIADKGDMLNLIVPSDAYNITNSEAYDGVFHARFFRFGKWEDIYIDDYIPVVYGNVPWGAKSSTNENEVWVSLLEKAFARLHGSYDAVYGGQPGDAYLQLTGGIGERVDLDEDGQCHQAFYRRIKNALNTGSQVTCVVPDEYDNYRGLVGGHAYSLVGVTQIQNTKLIRVRNPWGHGEWKGAWSDESSEFEAIKNSGEKVPQKDDGEFYIALEDFVKYFSRTTICSLTPDFDCDGISDPMNFILNVFGEWTNDKMGGFHDLLNNPRFSFSVTEEGMLDDGKVPLVIQMVQYTKKRKAGHASIRCDIYKIKGDKMKAKGRIIAAEIQGKKNNVFTTELQSSFRHKLKPGRYMAIPSTLDGGVKKAFLLRFYTPAPLKNIKKVNCDTDILSCENEESLTHNGRTCELTFDKTMFGAFISGMNAGGQVSNRDTYSTNPQYLISIPHTGSEVPLIVHIMQTQVEPQYPVGFRLFALDKGVNPPVNVDYLYDKYNDSPVDIEGHKSRFIISWDVDARYMLPAGRYVGLVHMDQPDTEKSFAIVFKSNTNIAIKGLQTGE